MTKVEMVSAILKPTNKAQTDYCKRIAEKLPKQEIEYYYNRAISRENKQR